MTIREQLHSIAAVLRSSWIATRTVRPRLFCFIILFVFAYCADLLTPWAIAYTLDVFVKEGLNESSLEKGMLGLAAYIGLKLLHTLLHHIARYLQIGVAYVARMNTMNRVFGALMDYPLNWHVRHHSGDSLSKLNRAAGAIESCIGTYVWQVIEGVVKVVFAGIAIFTLDFWVALNVLVTSILTILLVIVFNSRLTSRIRRTHGFWDNLNRIQFDNFFNIVTVKTLGLESKVKDKLSEQTLPGYQFLKKIAKYGELKWGATGLGYTLVIGSSLFIYFEHQASMGLAFEVGKVYVLINYLDRIFQAIGSFTGYYSGIIEAGTAYEDAQVIVSESRAQVTNISSQKLSSAWKQLAIKNVSYSYNGEAGRGLTDINLQIIRGQKIALVGPSGGGKSTLLKVMGGVIMPDTMEVSTDSAGPQSWQVLNNSCLLLPQEPEIFSDTLHYNITLGDEYESQLLNQLIKLGCLEDLLHKLPEGWNTDLAQKGLNISVGEKQRIALVRGILRSVDKDIILLDEPTSSLDPATEKAIFQALLEHFAEQTIITACHRLSIVPMFDRIILVNQGKIVEQGSFNELLDQGGLFSFIWTNYQEGMQRKDSDD